MFGDVEFFAISCSAHHWVCKDNNIRGYPTIRAYKSSTTDFTTVNVLTMEGVTSALGISIDTENVNVKDFGLSSHEDLNILDEKQKFFKQELLIASAHRTDHRTEKEIFNDAALSFIYALKNEIHPDHSTNMEYLDPLKKSVLLDWIDLLRWTLPSSWKIHVLINDLKTNFNEIIVSRQKMHELVQRHYDVILEKTIRWSDTCTGGQGNVGYSCGMWSLLHIVSIGVAERHNSVLGAKERISTKAVGRTLRNYIEFFFGCKPCQSYFVSLYDNCGFNVCKRLKTKGKSTDVTYWREFAMWLWEVHNDVTRSALEKEFQGDEDLKAKEIKEIAVWPSVKSCSKCYLDNESWDYNELYSYLKAQYWPSQPQNFRYVVLDKKEQEDDSGSYFDTFSQIFLIFVLSVVCSIHLFWKSERSRRRVLHKKIYK